MRPGDVVDGLRIVRIGATRDGVQQALVRDGADPAELLWMPAGKGTTGFLDAHRGLVGAAVDGFLAPVRLIERPEGVGVVRPWTDEPTLERLPARLELHVAAAIAVALLPALLSVPALGELRLDDVRADATGRAVLAPRFGRPPRVDDGSPARDLATLLHRWWTGRAPPPDRPPVPSRDDPGLDPRCDGCVAALWSEDPASALERLRALVSEEVDLRPLLRTHPASLPVAVTVPRPLDDGVPAAVPWRVLGWMLGLGSVGASGVALVTVVLAPLAVVGFLFAAASVVAGEVLARRSWSKPTPKRLADRTVGGQLAPAWDALDHLREELGAAELADAQAADVRRLLSAWEDELWAVASTHVTGGPVRDGVAEVRAAVVDRALRLRSLVARLAEHEESAGTELARWVHSDAP